MSAQRWFSVPGTGANLRVAEDGWLELAVDNDVFMRVRPAPPSIDSPTPELPWPGSKGYSQEFYERIAAEYQQLRQDHPRDAAKVLARRYDRSSASVQRWLARCRELGLLTGPSG